MKRGLFALLVILLVIKLSSAIALTTAEQEQELYLKSYAITEYLLEIDYNEFDDYGEEDVEDMHDIIASVAINRLALLRVLDIGVITQEEFNDSLNKLLVDAGEELKMKRAIAAINRIDAKKQAK